jgi:hypothetical protein
MISPTNAFSPYIDGGGLSLGVTGGVALLGTTPTVIGGQSVALTANATNYVILNLTSGLLQVNTSGFTTGNYPIATVVTLNASIQTLIDDRPDVSGIGSGGSSGPVNSLNNGKFISTGILNETMLGNGVTAIGSSEVIAFRQFILAVPMSIGECSQLITTASSVAGATNSYGIYSSSGVGTTALLVDSGPFDSTLNTGNVQTNSFTNVVLPVGVYDFAFVASDPLLQVRGFPVTGFPNLITKNGTVNNIVGFGSTTRNVSTHAMPATLGTLTETGLQNIPIAVWQF